MCDDDIYLWDENGNDKIGPGSEAWEWSHAAIQHGYRGREQAMREALDKMDNELVRAGASHELVESWHAHIAERVAAREEDDFDEDFD